MLMIPTRFEIRLTNQGNIRAIWCTMIAIGFVAAVPSMVVADATASANSNNWFFYKYYDQTSDSTSYSFASSALAGTFSYSAQAWNEGGTSGPKTYGPSGKFNNVAGAPVGKSWPSFIGATVPAPGTTTAKGEFVGFSSVDTGFVASVLLSRYYASYSAFAEVDRSTIPAGGFGKATATVTDPWVVNVPVANPGDVVEMHAMMDMSGSQLDASGPTGSGTLDFHTSLSGVTRL